MAEQKILIIEDDDTLLSVLKYNLGKEGYQPLTAKDGLLGLEAARRDKPDLIVLDLMLPKRDGWSILRELRSRGTQTPVPVLTALGLYHGNVATLIQDITHASDPKAQGILRQDR